MKKKSRFFAAAGLVVLAAALLFTACANPAGGPPPVDFTVPAALKGVEWVGFPYLDTFQISDTVLDAGGYEGTIVNIIPDGGTAGYIIIQYTRNDWNASAVGKFYTIHYKNLTSSSVDISACSDGDGKATRAEAETEYTVAAAGNYFSTYSNCYNLNFGSGITSAIIGTWEKTSETDGFIITDQYIAPVSGAYPYYTAYFIGQIISVESAGANAGYITFKYVTNTGTPGNVGKYCRLYWENLSGSTADMGIASGYGTFAGDEGQDTAEDAQTEYTAGNAAGYFDDGYNNFYTGCVKQ
jgi:hypothetical protein